VIINSVRSVENMKFVDRSIPELLNINAAAENEKIIMFSTLLGELGIEIIEIDKRSLKNIERFPRNIEYIYRVENEIDLRVMDYSKIKSILISVKDNSYERQLSMLRILTSKLNEFKDIKIILEVEANNIGELERYFNLPEGNLLFHASVLRIVGFSSSVAEDLKEWIENTKLRYDIEIDICAENSLFCATGIAVDALDHGIDYVTGTFAGIGGEAGYAALEQVILSAVVINNMQFEGNIKILQKIKVLVEEITGMITDKDKPIIGKDIFLCGSGVHVDGIMKNPKNYEPFEPEIVGLKRRIVLGKHSGANAVEWILKQNNIGYDKNDLPKIIQFIQEKSIELKSYFDGEDLRSLINELRAC
jgi:homocitrate synthase NifV